MSDDVQVHDIWRDKDERSPDLAHVICVEGDRVQYIRGESGKRYWSKRARFVKAFERVAPASPSPTRRDPEGGGEGAA